MFLLLGAAMSLRVQARTLVIGNSAEPQSLDPHHTESVVDFRIQRDLFEGLVVHDDSGGIIPGQAESWVVSNDAKTYIFKIRSNARWSNGDPVTAQDFVYSWRRLASPKTASPYAWYLEAAMVVHAAEITRGEMTSDKLGVKAVDDQTLQVDLTSPLPYFIKMLTMMNMVPLHKRTVERWGKDWTLPENLIGNGAYILKQWVVNEKVGVAKNQLYWNKVSTHIENVVFLPVTGVGELNRYKAGEIHLTQSVPVEYVAQLRKERSDEFKSTSSFGTVFITLNTRHPKVQDVRVRRALSYAISREALADKIIAQGNLPAYTLTPPVMQGFQLPTIDYREQRLPERIEQSERLLKQAGYSESNPLRIELVFRARDSAKKMAVAVSQMWKKIGVQTQLISVETGDYSARRCSGAFQALVSIWLADYNEASTMLNILTSGHSSNHGHYVSGIYDQLIIRSRLEQNEEARNRLYGSAEQQLSEDMPIIPLYHNTRVVLVHPNLGGYPLNDPQSTVYSRNFYWKNAL
ncbi:peptide ABC transporter substrate-binding protein [Parendozoicomonas sp. Alg238-R29]|uniref:peptide ABC transporter substrate-binding protein n=1 Tax=Parendozoicomonas sp. Alg238-R29 TaxID=2993446 RepID=UPI00248D3D5B|nr:peptide ABC transporter substrate-binding protein [Parendozoicomonas sp. Alg238-R29]